MKIGATKGPKMGLGVGKLCEEEYRHSAGVRVIGHEGSEHSALNCVMSLILFQVQHTIVSHERMTVPDRLACVSSR